MWVPLSVTLKIGRRFSFTLTVLVPFM